MTRIKLTIEYDGTDFSGWQSQINGRSVQDAVENALQNYFGGEKIRIGAAGRTDAGVHATGQVAHFDAEKEVNLYKLCLGVNLSLPKDVAVVKAETVADTFDARFSAKGKLYRYRIYVSPVRRPLYETEYAQIYKMPDTEKMRRAAKLICGTHDFAAFQKNGSNLVGTVRTVNSLTVEEYGDTIHLVIDGNAFLYNMVRIIAGTLVSVGNGDLTEDDVSDMLSGKKKRVKTMPAKGLCLEKVYY